ncbi:thermonuclease family protein [Thiobaca trueperi]|uniref:Nuclease-like protein n=1 Tax=Thiobaca trueperi TaxID=127458 RepID=A0A4R3MUL4_9GAMM|nr:nuclease-like protein [Thiobaca trueperi]
MGQRPWGQESRDYLRRIIPQQINLREHDRDRYGRIVGEVFGHAGQSLNLALVEAGQAAVYPRYCRESRYFEAQERARAARRGIWEQDGEHQTPWTWRRVRQFLLAITRSDANRHSKPFPKKQQRDRRDRRHDAEHHKIAVGPR